MSEKSYIYASKYKTGFPAILKTGDGTPLEAGQAMVAAETRAVDFVGDFVPLFKMGTPLEIVRTFAGQEIHSFQGAVYLSSEKLLRITSVRDYLVPGTEKYYMFPVNYPALIRVLPGEAPPPQRIRLGRRRQPAPALPEVFPITVTGLAVDALEFSSPTALPEGQQLLLSMEAPLVLEEAPIEIWRTLQFGVSGQNCSCRIISLPRLAQRRLEDLIYELHCQQNKFF